MKHTDEQFAKRVLGAGVTYVATKATQVGVYLARADSAKLSSFHFLYGILSYVDSSASTILQLNGCNLYKSKRLLLEQTRNEEKGFDDEAPLTSCSQDAKALIDIARRFAENSCDRGINTAHLLLGLYQPKAKASRFLSELTPKKQVIADLERLIQNQDNRNLEN